MKILSPKFTAAVTAAATALSMNCASAPKKPYGYIPELPIAFSAWEAESCDDITSSWREICKTAIANRSLEPLIAPMTSPALALQYAESRAGRIIINQSEGDNNPRAPADECWTVAVISPPDEVREYEGSPRLLDLNDRDYVSVRSLPRAETGKTRGFYASLKEWLEGRHDELDNPAPGRGVLKSAFVACAENAGELSQTFNRVQDAVNAAASRQAVNWLKVYHLAYDIIKADEAEAQKSAPAALTTAPK